MLLAFSKPLRDKFLLPGVIGGLIGLLGFGLELLAVILIREINDADDRDRRDERVKTAFDDQLGGDRRRGRTGEVRDRGPKEVFTPGACEGLVGLERFTQSGQRGVDEILNKPECRHRQHKRRAERTARQILRGPKDQRDERTGRKCRTGEQAGIE